MIKYFSVCNFLSFKDEQFISFEATPDKSSEEQLVYRIVHPKTGAVTRLLKMAAIYGANASGKTNLLKGIYDVWHKLFYAPNDKEDTVVYTPFALKLGETTSMKIGFFIEINNKQ